MGFSAFALVFARARNKSAGEEERYD